MGNCLPMEDLSKLFRPRRDEFLKLSQDDKLWAFLATFPTPLQYTKPQFYFILWVFWSQQAVSRNNSSSNEFVIHEKIRSSFYKFDLTLYDFDGLIQFWAPVTTAGRRLLTTSDQPFAVNYLDTGLDKFRLCSLNYRYNIDVNKLDVDNETTIISGAPASAFLNHLPEVVLDLKAHDNGCPLVRSALECDLMAYIVLPVHDPCQRCCVGVVECFMKRSDCSLVIFNKLNESLEGVGLSTFDVRECLPYKSIHGLKETKHNIEEALKIVCESHNLGVAQVWVPYKDESKHMDSSSFALKLTGLNMGCLDVSYNNYYQNACNMLALRIGEGVLTGKTLQNQEPHFCRDISNLSNTDLLVSFTAGTTCSYFGICLRSIDTGDFDYVFEFLWPISRNYVILVESLVLTLKRCLPNFKLASGLELGNELRILDVENSTRCDMGHFEIFKGNVLSRILPQKDLELIVARLEAKSKTTEIKIYIKDIEDQFGKTMKEAAKSLKVSLSTLKRKCKVLGITEWPRPYCVKRKKNDSCNYQSNMNEEDSGACWKSRAKHTLEFKLTNENEKQNMQTQVKRAAQTKHTYDYILEDPLEVRRDTDFDENTLTIKAEYADDIVKFHLPLLLATYGAIDMEISKRLKLNRGSFKLKYLDEDGDRILLGSEQDLKDYIKSIKESNNIAIRLLVSLINI
ncbi:hypothetical protein LXL04_005739 [Taraxacum kok-saghyz]